MCKCPPKKIFKAKKTSPKGRTILQYTTWKVDGTTPMHWFIMASDYDNATFWELRHLLCIWKVIQKYRSVHQTCQSHLEDLEETSSDKLPNTESMGGWCNYFTCIDYHPKPVFWVSRMSIPIQVPSMSGVFAYIWLSFLVNVRKYAIVPSMLWDWVGHEILLGIVSNPQCISNGMSIWKGKNPN